MKTLDQKQQIIVRCIVDGGTYEQVWDAIEGTIGHHVYDYVIVQKLIDIIKVLADAPPPIVPFLDGRLTNPAPAPEDSPKPSTDPSSPPGTA